VVAGELTGAAEALPEDGEGPAATAG
jgi:hypothetical protein